MTEDQAKKRQCPLLTLIAPKSITSGCCIGSRCMMWREERNIDTRGKSERGYCGLAGKP